MKTPKSPTSPRSPRSPRAAGATLTEYASDGRLAARWRVGDTLVAVPGPKGSTPNQQKQSSGLRAALSSAFLPEGYPASVTRDYPAFVFWHAVQGLSSYIRGILSSHAVLRGVGVGNEAATALGAVFQFFVRDVVGMAGGIAFAAVGDFQAYSKQWRLFADVTNDVAMAIDLASPLIPGAFLILACLGSIARAMVGMAAGATHAALTQHFAAAGAGGGGGAADLTAKADSRERAVNIIGSIVGMALTHVIADHVAAAWLVFVLLTVVHVWANVKAMRCLVLTSLNVPRLELLLSSFLEKGRVLTPAEMGAAESLLAPPFRSLLDLIIRRGGRPIIFGARPSDVLRAATLAASDAAGGRPQRAAALLQGQRGAEAGEYLVAVDGRGRVLVAVSDSADDEVMLHAYVHALHLSRHAAGASGGSGRSSSSGSMASPAERLMEESERWMGSVKGYKALLASVQKAGWKVANLSLPRPAWTGKWI